MTLKERLLRDSTDALRVANAYEQATSAAVKQAELAALLLSLTDDEIDRAITMGMSIAVGNA